MSKDIKQLTEAYSQMVEEAMTPLKVQKSASGKGETGGIEPGDLPSDAGSADAKQPNRGAESPEAKKADMEEAEKRLSPTGKVTKDAKPEKKVTKIQDSTMKKSFMDLYNEVIVEEVPGADVEDMPDEGDFPPAEGEEGYGEEEAAEGDVMARAADLFSQLAEVFGQMAGDEEDVAVEDEMAAADAAEDMSLAGESTIAEMKSEPEPRELGAEGNFSDHQAPNKLGRSGVKTSTKKKANVKGNDKKRTGELEDAPEGMEPNKKDMTVDGSGPAHKGKDSSFMED